MKQDLEHNIDEVIKKDSRGPVNYVTEFLKCPKVWKLDDERYTWLTERDKATLDGFDFDYGDILNAVKNFCDRQEVGYLLMTDQKSLDDYCLILWHKPWDVIWNALIRAARNDLTQTVFAPWAEKGNGVAIKIMENVGGVGSARPGAEEKSVRIRLVNDVEGD